VTAGSEIADAILDALRNEVIVIGESDQGESVLLMVQERSDGQYDYVPLARLLEPLGDTIEE
jgi:hypothetical protein